MTTCQPARILACLGAGVRAELMAEAAEQWADWLDAQLTFLHVADDTDREACVSFPWLQAPVITRHPIHLAAGRPDRVICQKSRELAAQMIILGAREREGMVTSILGSVARRVARRAGCSVLLLTNPRQAAPRRVVSTVSFDDRSKEMLQFVVQLARRIGTVSLDVIHEYDSYGGLLRILGEQAEGADSYQANVARDEQRNLSDFLADLDLEGLSVEQQCLDGPIGQEGVEYVLRRHADLLTVPSPERLGFWDRFFNHPTEMVLHRLPCALLLYRPLEASTPWSG